MQEVHNTTHSTSNVTRTLMQLIPAVKGRPKPQNVEIIATLNPTNEASNELVSFKMAGKVREASVIYGA